jgi:hypothetical protein
MQPMYYKLEEVSLHQMNSLQQPRTESYGTTNLEGNSNKNSHLLKYSSQMHDTGKLFYWKVWISRTDRFF